MDSEQKLPILSLYLNGSQYLSSFNTWITCGIEKLSNNLGAEIAYIATLLNISYFQITSLYKIVMAQKKL